MQIEKHVPGQLRMWVTISTNHHLKLSDDFNREDEYAQLLQSRRLWPVDPKEEQDWSGRGQHAKFQKNEQGLINSILEVEDNLGSTRTAVVQSVKCRRILLARKTITCGKQTMTREEAIAEVSHLTRLNHAHIVRVIGTYVKGRELSILLYPVADYNLETFLDKYRATPENSDMWWNMACSGNNFYRCLSSAVRCIHHNLTKHMDIKPQNILIRRIYEHRYSPYIADFGIARSYKTPKDIETDGRTSFTKRYAAPEVVNQGLRGLPADIFSLACVFLEMVSIYFIKNTRSAWEDGLQAIFDSNVLGDTSYQANARHLQLYLRGYLASWTNFSYSSGGLIMLIRMLDDDPRVRPTAEDLVTFFGELPCCTTGSVEFQERARDVRKDNG
jgi:serine/threonine protein kinase